MSDLSHIEKIVFDFDNTLFDTETKKQNLYKMAEIHGYSHDEARQIYKKARTENEKIIMSLSSYMKVLRERVNEDDKEFKSDQVSEIITELKGGDGLLPYAAEFLKYCLSEGLETYVLSLGQKDWQEEKVQQSGIKDFMPEDNIVYTNSTNGGKQRFLRQLFGDDFTGSETLFVNDKPDETGDILSDFPDLLAMLRREPRDDRYQDEDFKRLKEQYPQRVITYSEQLKQLLDKFKHNYED
ncbi:MAG: HAD family hydrolase [Candidatus Paceibacteria bacterium]